MRSWLLFFFALSSIGCGGSAEPETSSSETFLAFPANFQDFRSWTSIHSDGPDPAKFPEVAGARTLYVNKLPPKGSKVYPVGTIIVEVHDDGDARIFARVKRGGGFNSDGALDWEWFELAEESGKVIVNWRGFGPPVGETYGGDKTGCNNCHSSFRDNDFVGSAKLQLSSF
jgi:hypothetical protein